MLFDDTLREVSAFGVSEIPFIRINEIYNFFTTAFNFKKKQKSWQYFVDKEKIRVIIRSRLQTK